VEEVSDAGCPPVYVALGANLGDKTASCRRAVEMVAEMEGCRVCAVSSLYRTEPVGVHGHDWYVNAVIEVRSVLSPHALLRGLLAVESALGRVRTGKMQPRAIDLDLLLFGERVLTGPDLILPHPRMHLRRFVMVPLAEIAPGLVHPVIGATVEKLLETCPTEGQEITLWPSGGEGWGRAFLP
jgi:2-amino-4-hydroxy-6-hydroxymethyldihydropteridine diphosphokinase